MDHFRIISPYVHGIFDYIGAIVLLLAPNLFGFADEGGAAVWIPRVLGVAILGMALITNYRLGVLRILPMPAHLMVDYVAGPFLAVSPFLLGFADEDANVWAPHLLAGVGIFIVTLLTQWTTETATYTRAGMR
ncbi:MAG: hypothetical protein HC915_18030 [Anaerolineae bacterium]|nr:hypothetical protein [Anaerolineae bacterium]